MKKHTSPGTVIALCILTAVGTCNATMVAYRNQINRDLPSYYEDRKSYEKISEIQRLVEEKFIGPYDEDEMKEVAAAGYVLGMGDRWSSYLPREQVETLTLNLQGKTVGVGISVQYNTDKTEIIITEVHENSPAAKAGIKPGSLLLGADDKTLAKDGYEAVMDAARGEQGTPVTLLVRDEEGEELEKTMKRAKVVRTAVRGRLLDEHIGYVKIADFDGDVDIQCAAVVADLIEQGADSLIFDVRFNPGGAVDVLSRTLDPLLPAGNIITLKPKEGQEQLFSSDAEELKLPMAVLVNASSYSAAEFFAAALQEYDKAVIVGVKTIGKGYAQRVYRLSDGSGVNLSDQKYYTPKGKNLAGVGITPDVEIDWTPEQYARYYELTDEEDSQLQAAIAAVTQSGESQ